jgi:Protein of unknown function (DUF2752)
MIVINSPSTSSSKDCDEVLDAIPVLQGWVRGSLVGTALALAGVFAVAAWLNPYTPDGSPLSMATHRQMGLPPCTFFATPGLPCPSCGMTTSFALLVRGDVANSLRADAVGTLLALFCLTLILWCLASAACKRTLFIHSMERALTLIVLLFLRLMLLRWVIVLGLAWWTGISFQ